MLTTIRLNTPAHDAMVNITELVTRQVAESGVESGICVVYSPHTTAGVTINEGADPDVVEDMLGILDKLIPWRKNYNHGEGNTAAHMKSVLTGNSSTIIVEGGKLLLGTWERIFLCEFDGPRTRKIHINVITG